MHPGFIWPLLFPLRFTKIFYRVYYHFTCTLFALNLPVSSASNQRGQYSDHICLPRDRQISVQWFNWFFLKMFFFIFFSLFHNISYSINFILTYPWAPLIHWMKTLDNETLKSGPVKTRAGFITDFFVISRRSSLFCIQNI